MSRPRSLSTGGHNNIGGDTSSIKYDNNSVQKQTNNPNRYKTELCRPYQEYGHCRYGDKCQFAHGRQDMRVPLRHPRYKTEFCRTFHSQGYCPYGARCHFVHSTVEARPMLPLGGNGLKIMNSSSSQTSSFIPFTKPPLSPSQDSGISSPEGTPSSFLSTPIFEYPSSSDNSSDEFDTDYREPQSLLPPNDLMGDWDSMSTDSFSPSKAPSVSADILNDLTEKFSTTSLDDLVTSRSRLPVFNQLNSFSDPFLSN